MILSFDKSILHDNAICIFPSQSQLVEFYMAHRKYFQLQIIWCKSTCIFRFYDISIHSLLPYFTLSVLFSSLSIILFIFYFINGQMVNSHNLEWKADLNGELTDFVWSPLCVRVHVWSTRESIKWISLFSVVNQSNSTKQYVVCNLAIRHYKIVFRPFEK